MRTGGKNYEKRRYILHCPRGGAVTGSEQYADRPAIIVSNNECNKHSSVIEVVYMTTQPKADLPTHVTIRSTGRTSIALCEQVSSISTDRVNNYIGQVTDQEMKNIDIALMISLGLNGDTKTVSQYEDTIQKQLQEIDGLKEEIVQARQETGSVSMTSEGGAIVVTTEEAFRLQVQRDTYKEMYDNLIAKVMTS